MIENLQESKYMMLVFLCGILLFVMFVQPSAVLGKGTIAEGPRVLVVFSSHSGEMDEHERLLDLLITHFTSDLLIKNSKQVQAEDLAGMTHLIYFGQEKEQLPNSFLKLLPAYTGTFVAIGDNVEQLSSHFSFIKPTGTASITEVRLSKGGSKEIPVEPQEIFKVNHSGDTEVLIEAIQAGQNYPLLMKKQKNYYYATTNLFPPMSNFLAEVFHDVFAEQHHTSTQAYLRLEDIHPGLEADNVMEIARILEQRKVSYMVSVIPVYVNPETEEEYHFSDNPELVDALKYMQDHGGSIILHGYTDQFGKAETGEGFEFWNKEKNRPIDQPDDDHTAIKTRQDFSNNQEYETYLSDKKVFETAYIKNKVEKGIEELVQYGLYPLAFEAPHYAMSQNGYKVLAQYFSTYVGQVQLTDSDWRKMAESPYISAPTFLDGMTLLPETIRYVRFQDPQSIQEMKARVSDFTTVRDGVIGGFYHPFLGGKELIEVLNQMGEIPKLKWLDLKNRTNTVQTATVKIKTENGRLSAEVKPLKKGKNSPIVIPLKESILSKENITWMSVGAAVTLVMTIFSFILFTKTYRVKKRTGKPI